MNDEERKQVEVIREYHKSHDTPGTTSGGCDWCFLFAIIDRQEKEIAGFRMVCCPGCGETVKHLNWTGSRLRCEKCIKEQP